MDKGLMSKRLTGVIESSEFAIRIGTASAFGSFLRNIESSKEFIDLLGVVEKDINIIDMIFLRCLYLIEDNDKSKPYYMSAWDVAVACYMYILKFTSSPLFQAASFALQKASSANFFWTPLMVAYLAEKNARNISISS